MIISWQENGQLIQYPPEKLLVNEKATETMETSDWVFSGSQFFDNRYMAQMEGSIVAIFHDPSAIIDHRNDSGSDDTLFFANKNILPPVGTPVMLKLLPVSDSEVKERTRCNNKNK